MKASPFLKIRRRMVTYEKLVEDVNNLLDSHDNLPQPHTNIGEDNNSIHVDKSNGVDLNEKVVVKDAEITKLKALVDQLKFIHVDQGIVIRNLKLNHLKEKEKMRSDNRTLKFSFADLKKENGKLRIEKSNLDCIIAQLMKHNQKFVSDNNTLECSIVDMKKAGKNHKRKLKEIRGICDEE
ncbi:putative kinesin heavy chain isoform [Hordeum vulgare]|nr:putative kinesin heavy chain isoform [Hordeum vulgare]